MPAQQDLFTAEATHGLARRMPALSASSVVTRGQASVLGGAALLALAAAILWPEAAEDLLVALSSASFLFGVLFRCLLAVIGTRTDTGTVLRRTPDIELPVYTILVPLYREAAVLPGLARALLALDYPHARLDIKLVVEDDDTQTAAMAGELARRGPFHVIRVPHSEPRTKPKACNYALLFAAGEFTVIFDAEDRPERDQLRKAVARFRGADDALACLQARLAFYNADQGWLTRGIMAQTPLA